ncbi:MAG: hypothetical protein Kow00117_13960 [Phototrophicales bacterium]
MAIDYIIDFSCTPKQQFGTQDILERLKGEKRAHKIIELFRESGDNRPPSEMGFEFTRSTPEGQEETRVMVVQALLDAADQLRPYAVHCQNCPANRTDMPFGCIGHIQYPITKRAENWILDRLPVPDEPLVWLLLKQVVQEFKYDGQLVEPLREQPGIYFEASEAPARRLGELNLNANQIFEMLFVRRPVILPRQAALLLLFFGAIERDLEADTITNLDPAPADALQRFPFIIKPNEHDDRSISDLKAFLHALYIAWTLNVHLLIDA